MSTQTDPVLQLAAEAQTLSNRISGTGDERLAGEVLAMAERLARTLAALAPGVGEPGVEDPGATEDGYDAAKEGKAMAEREKAGRGRDGLAFR